MSRANKAARRRRQVLLAGFEEVDGGFLPFAVARSAEERLNQLERDHLTRRGLGLPLVASIRKVAAWE